MPPHIPAPYHSRDIERFFAEPPKSQARTPFQRDRARVLHSSALRRLGAKTQVLGAGSNDFSRTRLTHSLEVAQVGRDIAHELGCDPDIVDAACLSHDLGHPPFGHNGERVLNELARDIGGFEGNAQTLRLLARLEPKVLGGEKSYGLNLTRAALDAAIKYPWRRGEGPNPNSPKFGVYEDDLPVYEWAREGAPEHRKCLEAQVMDIADDIAYSVHDIEDAITGGTITLRALKDPQEREAALYVVQDWYTPHLEISDLDVALTRLENETVWQWEHSGDPFSAAALKDMCSQLIGRFVGSVVEATRQAHGQHALARFEGSVVIPEDTEREICVLKGLAAAYVMSSRAQQGVYALQEQILTDLFALFRRTGAAHLDPIFTVLYERANTLQERERVIVDQIASLTDVSAVRLHSEFFSGAYSDALAGDVPLPGFGPEIPFN
ncbi:deoxyguanosinetriphosphate triphosphohydrolase [Dermabacter sp. HMSC06F07]|uniref:Deoxyguanosinetriphosphate triphosphohydrolase-like protein n=1 Tax=Dermabacter hominis 1368 TaxID=1450519 RepID=A0ABR4SLU9_9MICO|nr:MULTISPECIES: deoxyguanosinetriphosphate triphosphohydrolase [unclassified Dermabacter]KDS93677.1 deoxyguanosinetriphosphate triphosphohydrolase [Dermabacter hominis 1368]MCT1709209.1 deoxyguanosinetriphosphate triphosphohydrolase [Dermabacter hominis]MDU0938014.1 deoxyguanosinetriphosphate triphosphohydrolase [Dermabacter sp.]MDU4922430.1 deoxyguanosinetriphosphate triphosphohydrolase [Dermabacter sp.]OFT21002.1 deoxyguanosinetriphosphate triphosphohydrolase [Dermabacter sp. HMSC08H10]